MTEQQAKTHAKNLRAFWAKQGYRVSTKIVKQAYRPNGTVVYAVRSDMVNGLPRAMCRKVA